MKQDMSELFDQLQDKISPILHNKKSVFVIYMVVALGVSILFGGAVTYLATYGAEPVDAAAANNDAALVDISMTPSPSPSPVPTTPMLPIAPDGGWTMESCMDAGNQMSASMSSFWTNPQGSGCNVLLPQNMVWITLP
jgi:hypothetical protein